MELGRIKPVDIVAFSNILTYYSFGAIMLHSTPFGMVENQWQKGMEYLYMSLIKSTGKCLH